MLRENGWHPVRMRGSHHHFKHPTKPNLVTVPGKPNDELKKGTLHSILRKAGLK